MVPFSGQGSLPPPISGKRPATASAEASPARRSASCWRAPPPIVIAWTPAPRRGRAPVAGTLLPIGELYPYPASAQGPSIQLSNGISSITGIFKLHKSKAGWVSGHPHAAQRAVIPKGALQLCFITIVTQVANIDLAVQGTRVSMHGRISHFTWHQFSKQKLLLHKLVGEKRAVPLVCMC